MAGNRDFQSRPCSQRRLNASPSRGVYERHSQMGRKAGESVWAAHCLPRETPGAMVKQQSQVCQADTAGPSQTLIWAWEALDYEWWLMAGPIHALISQYFACFYGRVLLCCLEQTPHSHMVKQVCCTYVLCIVCAFMYYFLSHLQPF